MNLKKTLTGIVGAASLFLASNNLYAQNVAPRNEQEKAIINKEMQEKYGKDSEYCAMPVSEISEPKHNPDRGDDTLAPVALGIYLLMRKYGGKNE